MDDAVQEALLHIWEERGRVDPSRDALAWENRVALNRARDHARRVRSRGRREELMSFEEDEPFTDDRWDPEAHAIAARRVEVLRHLICQIDASRRQLFVNHELLGTPIEEIAAAEGIEKNTARKRLRLAWEDLQEAARRWQAQQRTRGLDTRPAALLPPIALDVRSLTRRGLSALRSVRARGLAVSAGISLFAASLLPMWWAKTGLSLAPLPDVPAPFLPAIDPKAAVTLVTGAATAAPLLMPAKTISPSSGATEESLILQAAVFLESCKVAEALQVLAQHEDSFPAGRSSLQREALRKKAKRSSGCRP